MRSLRLRLWCGLAAAAVAATLSPAASVASDDATGGFGPATAGTTAVFSGDDVDGLVEAAHSHFVRSADQAAAADHGRLTVPSREQLRAGIVAALAAADPIDDILDESTDTDEQRSTSASGSGVAVTCSLTAYFYGRRIFGLPAYRYLFIEGVHSCGGAIPLLCLTMAATVSPQPFMTGLGFYDFGSGACFNRTNRSGFTPKPTPVVGVSIVPFLGEQSPSFDVAFIPFFTICC